MSHVTAFKNVRIGDCVTLLDFADEMGVAAGTVSGYRSRGRMPEPIGYVNGVPLWTRKQLDEYMRTRPGQGARTDMKRGSAA